MPWRDPDQQKVGGGICSTSGISSSDSRFTPAPHTPIPPDFQTFPGSLACRQQYGLFIPCKHGVNFVVNPLFIVCLSLTYLSSIILSPCLSTDPISLEKYDSSHTQGKIYTSKFKIIYCVSALSQTLGYPL